MAVNPFYPPNQGRAAEAFANLAPDEVHTRVLAANVNQTHTVPTGARYVRFGSDDVFFAKKNGAAAVPSGTITNGSGSEANPARWYLTDDPSGATTSIGLISPYACIVTMSFYKD